MSAHAGLARPARVATVMTAAVWLLAIGAPVLLAVVISRAPIEGDDAWAIPTYTAVVATWSVVGALIATRQPRNRIGWLILGVGLATTISLLGQSWALLSLASFGGTLPGTTLGAWLAWLFLSALAVALLFVPLLFPDGAPPSARWRPVMFLATGAIVTQALGTVLLPGPIEDLGGFQNPTGVPALASGAVVMIDVGGLLLLLCLPFSVLAPITRFRRGSAIERHQLKWFGSASGLAALGLAGATTLPQPLGVLCWMAMSVAVGLVPVAIAVAILRYRLFDIDRLISRTVAYAIVTVVLALTFVATNVALQAVLAGLTGSSTLVTAAATLVVAALFQPLRRRVQRAVDRRFDRARVDGELVAERLAAAIRDQVDLERLRGAVVGAVDDAVAPAGSAVWLRAMSGRHT
jgi:hypothetical protein